MIAFFVFEYVRVGSQI